MPLVKEEPPIISRGRTSEARYQDIADKLQADPKSWYRIADGLKTGQISSSINSGKLKAFQPESGYFEAVSRTVQTPNADDPTETDETVSVWARYMPPSEAVDGETLESSDGAEGVPPIE